MEPLNITPGSCFHGISSSSLHNMSFSKSGLYSCLLFLARDFKCGRKFALNLQGHVPASMTYKCIPFTSPLELQ